MNTANRAAYVAEAIRQGQAEVEQRYTITRAMFGVGANPCNEWAEQTRKGDKELGSLKLDPDIGKSIMTKAYFCSPLCICPLFWPHSLILCLPCSACYQCGVIKQAADAHHLTLYENYLLLTIDPYPSSAQTSSVQMQPCACCGSCVQPTQPVREVIPLQDIKSVGVEKCLVENCGNPQAPDSFVVKLEGSSFPCIAVDMPKDAEMFAKAIMDRVNALKAAPLPLPQEWTEYKTKLFGSGLGMGMMGMMGGMGMMQQQAMMQQQGQMQGQMQPNQQMMMQGQMNPQMMQQQQMMMQQQGQMNPAMMQGQMQPNGQMMQPNMQMQGQMQPMMQGQGQMMQPNMQMQGQMMQPNMQMQGQMQPNMQMQGQMATAPGLAAPGYTAPDAGAPKAV